MICILSISDRNGVFSVKYLERSPQPKVKEIALAAHRSVLLNRLSSECRGDNPLWADDAIASWLVRN